MTILVFLVDTSLSMGQRSYQGCSLVDVAKTIIDSTLKVRLPRFLTFVARAQTTLHRVHIPSKSCSQNRNPTVSVTFPRSAGAWR